MTVSSARGSAVVNSRRGLLRCYRIRAVVIIYHDCNNFPSVGFLILFAPRSPLMVLTLCIRGSCETLLHPTKEAAMPGLRSVVTTEIRSQLMANADDWRWRAFFCVGFPGNDDD